MYVCKTYFIDLNINSYPHLTKTCTYKMIFIPMMHNGDGRTF